MSQVDLEVNLRQPVWVWEVSADYEKLKSPSRGKEGFHLETL